MTSIFSLALWVSTRVLSSIGVHTSLMPSSLLALSSMVASSTHGWDGRRGSKPPTTCGRHPCKSKQTFVPYTYCDEITHHLEEC